MVLKIICDTCNEILTIVNKQDVFQSDVDEYITNTICNTDGPSNIKAYVDDVNVDASPKIIPVVEELPEEEPGEPVV